MSTHIWKWSSTCQEVNADTINGMETRTVGWKWCCAHSTSQGVECPTWMGTHFRSVKRTEDLVSPAGFTIYWPRNPVWSMRIWEWSNCAPTSFCAKIRHSWDTAQHSWLSLWWTLRSYLRLIYIPISCCKIKIYSMLLGSWKSNVSINRFSKKT